MKPLVRLVWLRLKRDGGLCVGEMTFKTAKAAKAFAKSFNRSVAWSLD